MSESSTSRDQAQLLRDMSPWTDALRGRLALPIDDPAPHRSELLQTLWIQFTVPATDSIRDTARWTQALRLLDVFATVDRRACWELIVDVCDARTKLRTLGCPLEFLVAVRPRFELHFDQHAVPTDEFMSLILDGDDDVHDQASGSSFARSKTLLLERKDGDHSAPLSPISLRFSFAAQSCSGCQAGNCQTRRLNGRIYERQMLASATHIARHEETQTTRPAFTVESFGVTTMNAESLRQIACKIPIHSMNCSSGDNYGPFFWRLLAPHDNVRAHLGLRQLSIDTDIIYNALYREEVVALCSAASSSRTLEEVTLKDTSRSPRLGVWPVWLAFALFSKTAQHHIHTLRLSLGPSVAAYVEAIKQTIEQENGEPVDKRLHPIQWPPTTIQINAQTKIHGFDLPEDSHATTVYHGKRPVKCLVASEDYGSSARILIPGVGIGCVARKDVISQEPATLRESHSIRNLSLSVTSQEFEDRLRRKPASPFDVASVIELLRLIGEPLVQLTLQCDGDRPWKSLRVDDILVHCPNLKSLKLVNFTLLDEQLCVSKHGHALQALTLVSCLVLGKPRPPRSTTYVSPYTFPRLLSLYVEFISPATYDPRQESTFIHDYVLELAAQRNLHRLVVKCSDPKQRTRYAAHVERHDGELIPVLPLREKLAFLSVVTAGSSVSSTAKYELTMDVVALVFDMASTSMRSRVCTLLD